jgi:hypothetical protein
MKQKTSEIPRLSFLRLAAFHIAFSLTKRLPRGKL